MEHYAFPSIEQFRDVVKEVRDHCRYKGTPLPTLTFHGTVKLHGTNAAVVYDRETDQIYAQSRSRVLTLDHDNSGFCLFVKQNEEFFRKLLYSQEIITNYNKIIKIVYGEWCGQGIMKGVAISQLPKMFVVFARKLIFEEKDFWYSPNQMFNQDNDFLCEETNPNVYFINQFPTFTIDIDFSAPELSQNKLIELTNAVEVECPVGKHFGVFGVGEGIVWTTNFDGKHLMFKVKGEKHSESKVKTLAEVDVEKVKSNKEFVEKVVTPQRLQSALEKLKEAGFELDKKNTGEYIRIVCQDVIKEEEATLVASNINWKEVASLVATKARQFYFEMEI